MDFQLSVGDLLLKIPALSACPGFSFKHIMTGANVAVDDYKIFFPYGPREICGCKNQACNCVYEDYELSRAFSDKVARDIGIGGSH